MSAIIIAQCAPTVQDLRGTFVAAQQAVWQAEADEVATWRAYHTPEGDMEAALPAWQAADAELTQAEADLLVAHTAYKTAFLAESAG